MDAGTGVANTGSAAAGTCEFTQIAASIPDADALSAILCGGIIEPQLSQVDHYYDRRAPIKRMAIILPKGRAVSTIIDAPHSREERGHADL
jgi:hypothetical protein